MCVHLLGVRLLNFKVINYQCESGEMSLPTCVSCLQVQGASEEQQREKQYTSVCLKPRSVNCH